MNNTLSISVLFGCIRAIKCLNFVRIQCGNGIWRWLWGNRTPSSMKGNNMKAHTSWQKNSKLSGADPAKISKATCHVGMCWWVLCLYRYMLMDIYVYIRIGISYSVVLLEYFKVVLVFSWKHTWSPMLFGSVYKTKRIEEWKQNKLYILYALTLLNCVGRLDRSKFLGVASSLPKHKHKWRLVVRKQLWVQFWSFHQINCRSRTFWQVCHWHIEFSLWQKRIHTTRRLETYVLFVFFFRFLCVDIIFKTILWI